MGGYTHHVDFGYPPLSLSTLFFETRFPTELGVCLVLARLADQQQASRIHLSLSHPELSYQAYAAKPDFYMGAALCNQLSMLVQEALYLQSHLPASLVLLAG